MTSPISRYGNRADPVARRQLARLQERAGRERPRRAPANRWGHVPLTILFEQAGNRVHGRPGGRTESGHEPIHGSKSGRCVTIDGDRGVWYCRSCRTGGGPAQFVMAWQGCTYATAAAWLVEQYGPSRRPGRLPVLEA